MKNNFRVEHDKVYIELFWKDEVLETVIDTDDFELVNAYTGRWYASYVPGMNKHYVCGWETKDGKTRTIYLHRLLYDEPKGMVIDHINHDTLDNTRDNTRVVTIATNLHNTTKSIAQSKVRNVYWCAFTGKWRASFNFQRKTYDLGRYTTVDEAKEAVRLKRLELKSLIEGETQ